MGYARDARLAAAVGGLTPGRLTAAGKHLRDCPGMECVHVMSEAHLQGLGAKGTLESVWEWWRDQQQAGRHLISAPPCKCAFW